MPVRKNAYLSKKQLIEIIKKEQEFTDNLFIDLDLETAFLLSSDDKIKYDFKMNS